MKAISSFRLGVLVGFSRRSLNPIRQCPPKVGLTYLPVLGFILFGSWTLHAQTSTQSDSPQKSRPATAETVDTGVYDGRDIVVPKVTEHKEQDTAATSFVDGFLRDARQHVGASVGVAESYTPNVSTSGEPISVSIGSIFPQAYMNFDTKRLGLHLNYGLSYQRFKEGPTRQASTTQNGTLTLSYALFKGRKTTLDFSSSF